MKATLFLGAKNPYRVVLPAGRPWKTERDRANAEHLCASRFSTLQRFGKVCYLETKIQQCSCASVHRNHDDSMLRCSFRRSCSAQALPSLGCQGPASVRAYDEWQLRRIYFALLWLQKPIGCSGRSALAVRLFDATRGRPRSSLRKSMLLRRKHETGSVYFLNQNQSYTWLLA